MTAFNEAWSILKAKIQCPQCGNPNAQLINEGELGDPETMAAIERSGLNPNNIHSIVCRKCGYDEITDV
jgi:predicted nucleic-acid-binding Zn-ribbon protein